MRQGVDATTMALYVSGSFDVHTRVRVANGSGTMKNLQGRYQSGTVTFANPNAPISSMSLNFLRETDPLGGNSLAPYVRTSSWNRMDDGVTYSPLLQLGRITTLEVALTAVGGARPADNATTWYEIFRGIITRINWPRRYEPVATITCADIGALLQKRKSEVAYTYTAGTSIETAIRQCLDNNGFASVQLSIPVATGKVLQTNYAPGRQKNTWDQVWALAQSIGYLIWYRYSSNNTLSLTLFRPNRGKNTSDMAIPQLYDYEELSIDEDEIGNAGHLVYFDPNLQRQEIAQDNNASINLYGGIRRIFWIVLTEDSPVRTSTDATAMLSDALSDVADPDMIATAFVPPMVFAETSNDVYTFPADPRFFTDDQLLAPFSVSFTFQVNAQSSSTMQVRGAPSAGSKTWTMRGFTTPGPNLQVSATPSATQFQVAWSGDNVLLSTNGATAVPPPSGIITVTRTGADQTLAFSATKDGQTVTNTVTVPAQVVYMPVAGGSMTGRLTLATASFTSYTADGVWNANATRPLMMQTAGGANLVFGYHDSGSGEYVPSLGFGAANGGVVTPSLLVLQTRVAYAFSGNPVDNYNRFQVALSGETRWGSGAATPDVGLDRESAGVLRTQGIGVAHLFHVAGALQVDSGSKIVIQNQVDGTSARGIFLWSLSDTNWAIYMAQSGAGRSINNGSAPGTDGITSYAMRFRIYGNDTYGFIWENHNELRLMSLNGSTGSLTVVGHGAFGGNLSASGTFASGGNLTVGANLYVQATGSAVYFGNRTTQHLNLWGTNYGIGVQNSTLYFRTDSFFAWHQGGTHNDGQANPGGGSLLMTLSSGGLDVKMQGMFRSYLYVIAPTLGSALQMWNDAAPNNAQSIGSGLPGQPATTDSMVLGRYISGTGWTEFARFIGGRFGLGTTDPTAVHPYARIAVNASDSTGVYVSVQNTGTGQSALQLIRTGGVSSSWIFYVPSGEDALVFFSGTGNRLKLTQTSATFYNDVSASGYTITGSTLVASGYVWTQAGVYFNTYGQYLFPAAAHVIALRSASASSGYLRYETNGAAVMGYVGFNSNGFGLFGDNALEGLTVHSDRLRLWRNPYMRYLASTGWMDVQVAFVKDAPNAPTSGDDYPAGTIWLQTA